MARRLHSQNGNRREDYVYDAVGRVIEVKSGTNLSAAGVVVGAFSYDAMGRLLTQYDYSGGANAYEQGGRGGAYTVQSGDTLQSIAANLSAMRR